MLVFRAAEERKREFVFGLVRGGDGEGLLGDWFGGRWRWRGRLVARPHGGWRALADAGNDAFLRDCGGYYGFEFAGIRVETPRHADAVIGAEALARGGALGFDGGERGAGAGGVEIAQRPSGAGLCDENDSE